MRKKSQYIKFNMLIIWAIMLVFVILTITIFAKGFIKKETDIRDAEVRIFANRIIYSPNGLSYADDESGRSYPGTVDLGKLTDAVLDNSVYIKDNQIIAAKVTLKNSKGISIRDAFYNIDWYNRWEPLIGRRGSGAASEIIEKRYVMIYDRDKLKGHGMLEIQVLIPNA